MSLLEIRDLTIRFGGLTAVNRVNVAVEDGKIFSIIGPNGAGKTTVFNAVTGIYEPTEGEVLFRGRDLKLPITSRVLLSLLLIGLLTGILAFFTINLEPTWAATITANFVYQQPFPYMKAWGSLFKFIGDLPKEWSVYPMLGGGLLGVAGGFAAWHQTRRTPNVIAAKGIARTFQNIRLFQEMTVLENVLAGMDTKLKTRFWDAIFRSPKFWSEQKRCVAKAQELLKFVELEEESSNVSRNLSYGHQRRLEIARALATEPGLLLLDEPAAGMNPSETVELMDLILKIRDRGVTVLLIEHHMRVVMGISDRIAVLDYGQKIAEGAPDEIRTNPKVIEAYLGKEELG